MTIEAKVIADSITEYGHRVTTMVLTYPRFIHAEFMTHRVFSRNASSSRAIPVEKMLAAVEENPVVPIHWGRAQPGMQAREELSDQNVLVTTEVGLEEASTTWRRSPREFARVEWLKARDAAVAHVKELLALGLHKQIANRLLEPWGHITVVVTGTDWDNFYALRCHPDAEPHMQALAEAMLAAHNASEPRLLEAGQWHLPFVTEDERHDHFYEELAKLSVARCARVSYLNHDKTNPDAAKDIELHDRLLSSGHMSPFEHQARAPAFNGYGDGNLRGWIQYRKLLAGENRGSFERLVKKTPHKEKP